MNGTEQPLERLNYYNGQRLEAVDFRLEQDYHLRVRRWLNKSLYTWGIAAGLEVTVKEGDPHKVVVQPGLALDAEGRESILLEAREIQVAGTPSQTVGLVFGNYLVIQYVEEKVAVLEDGCAVPLKDKVGQKIAWGGPSRIRSEPKISWSSAWPTESSGQIVLAQVELDEACAVRDIRAFVRKYVGAAKADKVRAFALEGEKDIDKDNYKVIYFHIEGGLPNNVLLYLRGAQFSTLYYTELGVHTHEVTVTTGDNIQNLEHKHTVSEGTTGPGSAHSHGLFVNKNDGDNAPDLNFVSSDDRESRGGMVDVGTEHTHTFSGLETSPPDVNLTHQHAGTGTTSPAGTSNVNARVGETLTYVNNLCVAFGSNDGNDIDITDLILAQLRDRDGSNTWPKLGNGDPTHDLVTQGTREIDLIRLGLDLSPGEHHLTLSVADGGGKIQYNLYVE